MQLIQMNEEAPDGPIDIFDVGVVGRVFRVELREFALIFLREFRRRSDGSVGFVEPDTGKEGSV